VKTLLFIKKSFKRSKKHMHTIDRENRNNAMTSDKCFMKRISSIKPLKLTVQVGLVCGLVVAGIGNSIATPLEQAKRMHDRLAGIPPTKEMLCAMEWLIASAPSGNGEEQAAHLVMSKNPAADSQRIPDFAAIPASCGVVDNSLSKKAFYSVSLKNFVTPWTNEERTVHADLNDYSALVIGMIRDDEPFDEILSTDLYYQGNPVGVDIGPADPNDNQVDPLSESDNGHYKDLQDQGYDLSDPDVLTSNIARTNFPAPDSAKAGVITTRAASLAFFTGGTNRLMWRATSMNYLCRDLEQMKDVSRVPDRIRQDVSRSPGGDSSIFLSSCMGCHAGMDPLTGAYAYYDHEVDGDGVPMGHMLWQQNSDMFGGNTGASSASGVGEALFNQYCASCHSQNSKSDNDKQNMIDRITGAISSNQGGMGSLSNLTANDIDGIASYLVGNDTPAPITVTEKNLINSGNFKYGYVTVNDQWTNYWREGPNSALQWGWDQRIPDRAALESEKIASGNGAASLGYEVTSSRAFAQCQVEKVYKFVCLHDPIQDHKSTIDSIVDDMPGDQYKMKNVFAKVAPLCMGD
jgi:hypothetical protein